jgi:DHA1 family bicyclomycin/chloramphenicol resistance-like MFS transporter
MRFPRWLPLLLGFLQAVGPLSIDMYLPAFPAIEREFHAAPGAAQVTLATWILGLSMGQLALGALADRFGRRAPLLFGTAIYALAAAGCALAPSMLWLAVWRFVAAIGASASMIVPRAMVRDVADGHDAARLMARLLLILGAAPILAPSLGGLVLQFGQWREIFWIMAGYGAVGLLLALWKLPDTLPHSARVPIHPASMLARYRAILTERGFLTHTLVLAFVAFALFAYLGGMPTVFITIFHLTPGQFALVFGGVAASYILCSQLNVHLVHLLGLDCSLHVTTAAYVVLIAALAILTSTHHASPWVMAGLLALAQGMMGFISPSATVGALSRHAGHAGSASAVMGTMQFLIGSSSGFLMAWLADGTARPMVGLMLAGAVAMKLADLARPSRIAVATVPATVA